MAYTYTLRRPYCSPRTGFSLEGELCCNDDDVYTHVHTYIYIDLQYIYNNNNILLLWGGRKSLGGVYTQRLRSREFEYYIYTIYKII